ncbi:MAG: OB-fold nucleic acid binding domain-containing protein, partial [Anaerolineales bacterium]
TLTDARHEEQVRVAGMVAAARPYKTKSDKMMGFVTLEDMTGNIELVIFPRTWDKFRDLCVEGKVVVVDGKVDAANQPPKVLVDVIRTDATYYESPDAVAPLKPGESPQAAVPSQGAERGKAAAQPPQRGQASAPVMRQAPAVYSPPPVGANSSTVRIAEPAPEYPVASPDNDLDDMPPPPEAPPDWETYSVPEKVYAAPATPLDDMLTLKQFDNKELKAKSPQKVEEVQLKAAPPQAGQALQPLAGTLPATETQPVHLQPIAPPPLVEPAPDDGLPPRLLTVFLRPSADPDRDRRRIKNVYGILISHHGKDRFQFQIFENGRGHLIDFPNDTTRIAPEMLERLKKLMGDETWRIEEITFQ